MRRTYRGAALALALCAGLAAPTLAVPLGVPIPSADVGEGVRWSRPVAEPSVHDALARRLQAARDRTDSLSAWATALGDSLLRPYALRRIALLHLASGDSASADGFWASLSGEQSPWQWDAVRARSDLALARGATARADSLLERANRVGWSDARRVEWLARRVALRLSLGDSTGPGSCARQVT